MGFRHLIATISIIGQYNSNYRQHRTIAGSTLSRYSVLF